VAHIRGEVNEGRLGGDVHRRYKLRLGDGTVLLVDQHGLNTWRVDDKAMVQGAGGRWRPLKDILAMQQAAAKYAAQQESSARPALPLIPPKPREDKSPRGPDARASGDLVEAPSISDPAGVQALAEKPPVPGGGYAGRKSTADEGVPIIPAEPLAEDEAPPILDTFSQGEPPGISLSEPPELEAWADDPGPSADSLSPPSPPDEEIPVIPLKPLDNEAPERPAPSRRRDPIEPSPITARPSLQVLADDPAPRDGYTESPSTPDDDLPTIPLKPRDNRGEAYAHTPTGPGIYEGELDDFVERAPRRYVLDERLVRAIGAFVRAAGVFGGYLSWSLDHVDRGYRWLGPRFQDALARWRAAHPSPSVSEEPQPSVVGRYGAPRRAVQKLFRRLGGWASAWTVGLRERIDRLARRYVPELSGPSNEPTVSSDAYRISREAPTPPPSTSEVPELVVVPEDVEVIDEGGGEESRDERGEEERRRAIAGEEPPLIRPKPLDGFGAPLRAVQKLFRRLGSGASAWALGLKGRVDRLARRYRPGPSGPSSEPEEVTPPYWLPREPLKAPPSTSELPVLRLAEIHEPEEAEDVYEGGGESLFPAAWLWTKRIVLSAGLVAGVILAARTWETWFPKATHLVRLGFTEMNTYVQSREQKERERQALQEATEQLPHLAPDTIRLVLSRSPTGVLDPPEVFQAACDAADRGLSALRPEEAEELKALRSTLLDTLSPAEGERVREYDRVRARRTPFAFEDQSALELFARGARALPSESRERLQALVGKAIAAGLARPVKVAPGAVGRVFASPSRPLA